MNTILNEPDFINIKDRIEKVTSDAVPVWGSMNANEMICHVSDPIRDILGIRNSSMAVTEEMRLQIIPMILDHPIGRNLPTSPPYLQGEGGGGTKPTNFEADKKTLLDLIEQFLNTDKDFQFHNHATLGILSREQFGVYLWKHFDHHLRSFGL